MPRAKLTEAERAEFDRQSDARYDAMIGADLSLADRAERARKYLTHAPERAVPVGRDLTRHPT